MKRVRERSIKTHVANFFGYLGYLFCFLQWFWVALLYFSMIQSAIVFVSMDANAPVRQAPSFAPSLADPVATAIVAAVVVIMIIITVYALIRLPMNIVKNSEKVVYKTSQSVMPAVMKVQHKKDTKKNRAALTPRIIVAVKLILLIIPVILVGLSGMNPEPPLDYSIAVTIGYGLAGFCGLFFGIQYLIAKVFYITPSHLK